MKIYFKKLFDYDVYANKVIINTMLEANYTENAINIMAHTLTAQRIWLMRCKKEPINFGPVWPEIPQNELLQMAIANSENWLSFLDSLSSKDFERIVHYKNSKGEAFSNQLQDIIAHVINHGTHHRAQIGQLLKQAGYGTLPVTNYILFVRGQSSR